MENRVKQIYVPSLIQPGTNENQYALRAVITGNLCFAKQDFSVVSKFLYPLPLYGALPAD